MKGQNLLMLAGLATGAYLLLRNRPAQAAAPRFVGSLTELDFVPTVSTVETPIMFEGRAVQPGKTFSNFDDWLKYERDFFHRTTGIAPGITPLDMSRRDPFIASVTSGLFT